MKKILWSLVKKYKWYFLLEFICIVIAVLCLYVPSKLLGNIIDLLGNVQANKVQIFNEAILLTIFGIGFFVFRVFFKSLDFTIEMKMHKDLKCMMFDKMLKIKIEKLNEVKNGEVMSYFATDERKVIRVFVALFSSISRIVLNVIFAIITMCLTCTPKMTWIAIIPLTVSVFFVIILKNRISDKFTKAQKSFTELSEFVQESTDSVRTMKAFVGEDVQIKEFYDKNLEVKQNNFIVTKSQSLIDVLSNLGFGFSYAIALLIGSKMVVEGVITVGNMVSFFAVLGMLEFPISTIPWIMTRYKKFRVSCIRLAKLFSMDEENNEIIIKDQNKKFDGNIKINNLTFNYKDYLEPALSNISFDVKKGESIGIIGVVGSGKSTLMNLLLKLYEVPNGKIFIDGKDINEISINQIRSNICYITQDNFLFSSTLKNNINLFKDIYKTEEIEASTKKAMIYDDIQDMEEGLETIIGEKGIDLSGGQKQRVVISRAFLQNSDIVIFDDTFSALDNRTEQHVLNNIKELIKGKTCFIVSNRISDIKFCDKIIVLEHGKIVERGNHETLINERGKYYEFYENQAHKVKNDLLV